jgi:hypothetical protein
MRQLFLAIASLLLLCSPGLGGFYTGNMLLKDCETDESACIGYVAGAFDGITQFDTNYLTCPPPKVILQQVMDVVVDHLKESPADRHLPAVVLAARAMHRAWPCS